MQPEWSYGRRHLPLVVRLATDEHPVHRRGGHVEAYEEESARWPPLIEQVRGVGRVDVDTLGSR